MLDTSQNELVESFSEALVSMAFIMALPPEDELPTPQQGTMVWMDFKGPISGRIELLADQELIRMAAANIIGAEPDEEIPRERGVDALKEILNTTCGVLLTRLAQSPADLFDITVPESEDFNEPATWTDYINQPDVTVLDADGFLVALRMTVKES
ncbi:MAG: chemotaxis protein CheX [Sedimentisphaerales bacterium]|nr:chemotaxis protein CheX [Sedimentisphaerales bacterium]